MTEGIIAPIIIILIMILLLAGLRWMQNKHYSFTVRVLSALVGGIVFGAILQLIFGLDSEVIVKSNNWISIVGNGYVRLLNMIVIPLVFVAISTAIINQKAEDLKKSAITILSVLLITTAIAA
ncbi:MAG: cation:dicarboxylase symporter family transporter, partial [Clostridium sp.]|nr:cation:dicarboxylase symporter family transporter [Clostridium sp.]